MNLSNYTEVKKFIPISKEGIAYCPFCDDILAISGKCKCDREFMIFVSQDRANPYIYCFSYILKQNEYYFKVHYNFSMRTIWIQEYDTKSKSYLSKEVSFDLPSINFLFESFDQVETYLLFN